MSSMKAKNLIIYLLIFIINLSIINISYAHPLDISNSIVSIKKDEVSFTTYFHSFEIDYLLKENWKTINSLEDYYSNQDIIKNYIKNNIQIKNNSRICNIDQININEDEIYNILTDWLKVEYNFICNENIKDIDFQIKYFNNFPLQTNRLSIYNLNNSRDLLIYKILTPKIDNLKINDINNYLVWNIKDSDCDWLSDEDEKIYQTDINKIDTDWDNYSDNEEVEKWWNPTDRNLWPWQEYKSKISEVKCIKDNEKKEQNNLIINKSTNNNDINSDTYAYWNEYLKKTLKYINNFFINNEWNILYIFLLVYILWIIHAIWPGHSKSLLVAYTLQEDSWYKKWLLYSLIFSVTHIVDILILFWITTLVFHYVDVSKYSYYIQATSILFLIWFSIYLIYKAFYNKNKFDSKDNKKSLMIAFLSWLAPCSFAWSIYFLLLSIWKISMILPLIIALWLWILSTLSTIVIITIFLKNKTLDKTKIFSQYSNKISAIVIFIISLSLWIWLLNT